MDTNLFMDIDCDVSAPEQPFLDYSDEDIPF
jgi:hypothetical protein